MLQTLNTDPPLPRAQAIDAAHAAQTASRVLWLALVVTLAAAVQLGAVPVHAGDWVAGLMRLFSDVGEPMPGSAYVLWHVRLPRALFALLVGASLALAGALVQGLFRNPLADPQLLGVTSGAACMAALVLTVFAAAQAKVPAEWRLWVLPSASFVTMSKPRMASS